MVRITAAALRLSAGSLLLASLLLGATGLAHAAEAEVSGQLAFIRGNNIWLMDLGDRTIRQLTTSGDCAAPSWSPDGSKLVYVRGENWRESYLWVLDVAAGKAARLTEKPSQYQFPRWSPDGEWVACFAFDDGVQPTVDDDPSRLLKINMQTKAATVLARGIWGVKSLSWAPEASALAYAYGTKGSATLAGLLLDEADATPQVFREVGGGDEAEVTIQDVRWAVPEVISFAEFVATEEGSLTAKQITADGKVTTVCDFGTVGRTAIPLSDTDSAAGPWLLTDDEGLWLWQDGEKTKLLEEASDPAWAPAP